MGASRKPQTIKVLLVEDDAEDAAVIRGMLGEAGPGATFEVEHADRFSTAVRRLSRGSFDVVVLALALPDTQEFRGVCRLCGLFPELPIVVLARLEDEVLGLSAIREGAQDYLVKGQVDRRMLARSIRHAVERKRGQREGILATLDRFPVGVLLLNEEGRVFLSNRAAEEILAEGDGLSLEDGFLRTGSIQHTTRLQEAIRRATEASFREPALPVEGPVRPAPFGATSVVTHGGAHSRTGSTARGAPALRSALRQRSREADARDERAPDPALRPLACGGSPGGGAHAGPQPRVIRREAGSQGRDGAQPAQAHPRQRPTPVAKGS